MKKVSSLSLNLIFPVKGTGEKAIKKAESMAEECVNALSEVLMETTETYALNNLKLPIETEEYVVYKPIWIIRNIKKDVYNFLITLDQIMQFFDNPQDFVNKDRFKKMIFPVNKDCVTGSNYCSVYENLNQEIPYDQVNAFANESDYWVFLSYSNTDELAPGEKTFFLGRPSLLSRIKIKIASFLKGFFIYCKEKPEENTTQK